MTTVITSIFFGTRQVTAFCISTRLFGTDTVTLLNFLGTILKTFRQVTFPLKFFSHTPEWASLNWCLSQYQHLYIDNPVNEHVFGELVNYLAMSID